MDKIKLHLRVDPDSDLGFFPMVAMVSDDCGDPNSFNIKHDLVEKMGAVLSRRKDPGLPPADPSSLPVYKKARCP